MRGEKKLLLFFFCLTYCLLITVMLHDFCLEEAESRCSSGSLCHPGLCSLVSKFSCVFDHLWFIFSNMAIFFWILREKNGFCLSSKTSWRVEMYHGFLLYKHVMFLCFPNTLFFSKAMRVVLTFLRNTNCKLTYHSWIFNNELLSLCLNCLCYFIVCWPCAAFFCAFTCSQSLSL